MVDVYVKNIISCTLKYDYDNIYGSKNSDLFLQNLN